MRYRGSSNDDTLLITLGVGFLLWNISFFSNPKLDLEGILFLLVWFAIFGLFLYDPIINYHEKYKIKVRKCEHGIVGGKTRLMCGLCNQINTEKQKFIEKLIKLESEKELLLKNHTLLSLELKKRIIKKLNTEIQFLRKIDPFEFEEVVANMYSSLGFTTEVTSKTNDEGKDIILKKNGEITYVECKRFGKGTNVSRPVLQKLYGVMVADDIKNGIIVTTSGFTKECIEFSKKMDCNIELIGEKELIKMLKEQLKESSIKYKLYCEYNLYSRVTFNENYSLEKLEELYDNYEKPCGELTDVTLLETEFTCKNNHKSINQGKKIHQDFLDSKLPLDEQCCPTCGKNLAKKKQIKSNKKFWACSGYPSCTFKKSLK